MIGIILIVALLASFPIFCCALIPTPEDRARDDESYVEWLKERRKKKEVHQ